MIFFCFWPVPNDSQFHRLIFVPKIFWSSILPSGKRLHHYWKYMAKSFHVAEHGDMMILDSYVGLPCRVASYHYHLFLCRTSPPESMTLATQWGGGRGHRGQGRTDGWFVTRNVAKDMVKTHYKSLKKVRNSKVLLSIMLQWVPIASHLLETHMCW